MKMSTVLSYSIRRKLKLIASLNEKMNFREMAVKVCEYKLKFENARFSFDDNIYFNVRYVQYFSSVIGNKLVTKRHY